MPPDILLDFMCIVITKRLSSGNLLQVSLLLFIHYSILKLEKIYNYLCAKLQLRQVVGLNLTDGIVLFCFLTYLFDPKFSLFVHSNGILVLLCLGKYSILYSVCLMCSIQVILS